jgi:tRNA(Ile)-lysidine synthase
LKKISKFWKIPLYPDKTNQSLNYSRNRIRKQILPTIRFFFNPKVDNVLFQFSEIAITEQIFLDSLANRILKKIYFKTKKIIALKISIFNYLPIAIQRRIIKKSLKKSLLSIGKIWITNAK